MRVPAGTSRILSSVPQRASPTRGLFALLSWADMALRRRVSFSISFLAGRKGIDIMLDSSSIVWPDPAPSGLHEKSDNATLHHPYLCRSAVKTESSYKWS